MRIAIVLSVVSSAALLVGCESTYHPTTYSSSSPPVYGGEIISSGPYGATMVVPPPSQVESDRAIENSLRSQLNRYGDLASVSPAVEIYSQMEP